MGSSGGGSSSASYYQQQQNLALQREQMALSQRQHEEQMALQREALDKPVAAIARTVSQETRDMVDNQQSARNALRGIRSTYGLYARRGGDDDGGGTGGKTRLGD